MSVKKLFTRAEFEQLLKESASGMAADKKLQADALNVFIEADKHRWVHQTRWMGEPILNIPHDMFAIQDIIFRTRPKFILEIGVAWGGALLFYATLMEILGGEKIIGVDIFIPEDLKERLTRIEKLARHFTLIQGSSVEAPTIDKIKAMIGDCRDVLLIVDSHHTHEHVMKELEAYAPLVGPGHYIVCSDTIIDNIPPQEHRPREWGPGNNPKTAVFEFLKKYPDFMIDTELENKLLFTCNPQGYLVRKKAPA
ncbi:MAG: class I SAM-dependent methyltransferase [Candidatus Omnitrophica bacterium]|nr:class I SAM-dependent methyltransferase [Candidatus Omnitrophota bacterium]